MKPALLKNSSKNPSVTLVSVTCLFYGCSAWFTEVPLNSCTVMRSWLCLITYWHTIDMFSGVFLLRLKKAADGIKSHTIRALVTIGIVHALAQIGIPYNRRPIFRAILMLSKFQEFLLLSLCKLSCYCNTCDFRDTKFSWITFWQQLLSIW